MTEARHAIALDLGGTDLKFARVARDGSVIDSGLVPSRALDGERALMAVLASAAAGLREGACAVGLGCPGVIDPRTGALVDETPHLALPKNFPITERLSRDLGLPVYADNDANLAAWGEARMGAARGARVSVTFTVGTGVGCGIVAEGRVLRGAWGGAGEVAHAGMRSPGPVCECGVAGCLEPLSSGSGLARRALEAGIAAAEARDVFVAAEAGNRVAARLIAEMADALGQQIATVVQVVNPEVIVVGGGIARAGEAWLEAVRQAVRRYAMTSHTHGLRIVAAALGNRAGVTGAGLLAWERTGWAEG